MNRTKKNSIGDCKKKSSFSVIYVSSDGKLTGRNNFQNLTVRDIIKKSNKERTGERRLIIPRDAIMGGYD